MRETGEERGQHWVSEHSGAGEEEGADGRAGQKYSTTGTQ